ncbi:MULTISPECIES: hypothetical protein [Streptomyces]|uniref:Tat pathway signal sequence domain protein n=1 Tax=Streptomyces venezuelae TaxID=54571 RepID=A0A5P2BE18_STRVZ|nr:MULTISPECIES: hypothetical protein [Streptomyces]MYY83225.1 hypothetical protein [Streptomyces sp. SID335]MYZ14196.1 hypothetical protein [Streptomyces sp. SID337]NDZ86379.1 hypothetical protein [Streptomyces sp. SID10115]NEB44560.1 hypothetical protein [Streptomyces sp. SID339]QES28307.1 hypothetical protein DEJ47_19400 [Streptomyces venezuelae]
MKASWASRSTAPAITLVGAAFLAALTAYAPAPTAHAAVTTVEETARAGSAAGEGRERPGGMQPPILDPTPVPHTPPPVAPPPRQPVPTPVAHRDTASDPTERPPVGPVLPNLRVLPLGGGLVLIGLGLGFLGLRLRRG